MTPAAARVRRQLEAWESTRNLYRPSRSTNEDNAGHNYLRNDSATAEELGIFWSASLDNILFRQTVTLKGLNHTTQTQEVLPSPPASHKVIETLLKAMEAVSADKGVLYHEEDIDQAISNQQLSFTAFLEQFPTRIALLVSELSYCMLDYHRWRITQIKPAHADRDLFGEQQVDVDGLVKEMDEFSRLLATKQSCVSTPEQDRLRFARRVQLRRARKELLKMQYTDEADEEEFKVTDGIPMEEIIAQGVPKVSSGGKRVRDDQKSNQGNSEDDTAERRVGPNKRPRVDASCNIPKTNEDTANLDKIMPSEIHSTEDWLDQIGQRILSVSVLQRKEKSDLHSGIKALQDQCKQLQERNTELAAVHDKLSSQLSTTNAENEELRRHSAERSKVCQQLGADVGGLRIQVKMLEGVRDLNEKIHMGQKKQLLEYATELTKVHEQATVAQREIESIQNQLVKLSDMEQDNAALKTHQKTLIQENVLLRSQHEEIHAEMGQLHTHQAELTREVVVLRKREHEFATEITSLYGQRAEHSAENARLRGEALSLKQRLGIWGGSSTAQEVGVQTPTLVMAAQGGAGTGVARQPVFRSGTLVIAPTARPTPASGSVSRSPVLSKGKP